MVGKKCYQRIEATVDFDGKYDVVDSKMVNGKLITYEEYKRRALTARLFASKNTSESCGTPRLLYPRSAVLHN